MQKERRPISRIDQNLRFDMFSTELTLGGGWVGTQAVSTLFFAKSLLQQQKYIIS
jgi:hypothetical protein